MWIANKQMTEIWEFNSAKGDGAMPLFVILQLQLDHAIAEENDVGARYHLCRTITTPIHTHVRIICRRWIHWPFLAASMLQAVDSDELHPTISHRQRIHVFYRYRDSAIFCRPATPSPPPSCQRCRRHGFSRSVAGLRPTRLYVRISCHLLAAFCAHVTPPLAQRAN